MLYDVTLKRILYHYIALYLFYSTPLYYILCCSTLLCILFDSVRSIRLYRIRFCYDKDVVVLYCVVLQCPTKSFQ